MGAHTISYMSFLIGASGLFSEWLFVGHFKYSRNTVMKEVTIQTSSSNIFHLYFPSTPIDKIIG